MRILSSTLGFLGLLSLNLASALPANAPEPGPEDGGLRLRLLVTPRADAGKEGYDVTLDLLNVLDQAITLQARWRNESDGGDLTEYLDAHPHMHADLIIKH